MILKAIIVDDEKKSLSNVSFNLTEYCSGEVEIVGKTQSPLAAINLIDKLKPEILFLDIQMPNLDGFQLLEKIKHQDFFLVFITAYSKYGVRAIKASAFDYLLKPIDPVELKTTVQRITKIAAAQKQLYNSSNKQALEILKQNLKKEEYPKQIMIPYQDYYKMVNVDQIFFLQADVNYTLIRLYNEGDFLVAKTLKSFADLLDKSVFIRIHKSYIVNKKYIKETIKLDNYFLILQDGLELPIARRRAKYVLDKLALK